MIRSPRAAYFGATPAGEGFVFRLWAQGAARVTLHLHPGESDRAILVPCTADPKSVWQASVPAARAGDRYAFSVDDGPPLPDPAGRFLPDGVHGWSAIVDPRPFRWTDAVWPGLDPRRAVIYELHVGTFTPEGTFAAAIGKLPHLRELGVTAIEIMPVADFAGRRNWGYDGVALFAPSRAYGRPDDFRALVDAAHGAGLAVILDVVYNHLGPEGSYLTAISPAFLTGAHETPWGGAVNLDAAGSAQVRALLRDNALHWIDEYHVDGLRLDATHSLFDARDRHFVAELAEAVHRATDPRPVVYAEDHRNLASMVTESATGGWDLDGLWADDYHHVVRRMLAGDRQGYYEDYEGTATELAATIGRGWLFTGQHSRHQQGPRGTDPGQVALRKSVVCVQNHDQVGNRAVGDRLHHVVDAASWRAAVAVLLAAPMTPLLFMGQEWATSAPFRFFTDFEPDLGAKVVEGRRREFSAFPEFATAEGAARVPDPQADDTFEASRLRWDEIGTPAHARVLALHRALLRVRGTRPSLQASDATSCWAGALDDDTIAFTREDDGDAVLVVARLRGAGSVTVPALERAGGVLIDTEDAAFTDAPQPPVVDRTARTIAFARPGAVLFETRREART
jgi:maltooligosyltrehalose trehalohydrolase